MNLIHSFLHVQIIAGVSALFAIMLTAVGCKETTSNPGGDNLSDPAVQPMVVSTLPASGSTGPFSFYDPGDGSGKPHIVLTFNKLMFKGSFTRASFKIFGFDAPASAIVEGSYYYYGPLKKSLSTSSIYYDNVLSFSIIDSASYSVLSYRVGRQYTVILDSTVEDINGNHLASPYIFSYTPEPYFRVTEMDPKNGTQDYSTRYNPYIIFNCPVNASILGNVQLSPATPGKWRITSDSLGIYFDHAQPFAFNTNFGITLQGTATDAELHPIDREYASAFSTTAFRASNISPQNGSTNVGLATSIYLWFTGDIDTGTVRSGFSLSPPAAGFLNMYYPTSYFSFNLLDGLRQNTTYTLSVTPSLKASDGTLSVPTTSTFTTGPFVVQGYPGDGSINVSRSVTIQISATGRLDGATIDPAISFSPAIPGSISYYQGSSYFYYYPSILLAANTLYTVTVSTALATKVGDHLAAPYTFSFTTGN